jgi:CRP/FNR family cyclic AMP-dependent transcriptional regulator
MAEFIERNQIILLLSGSYLFCDLNIEELEELAKNTTIRTAAINEVIFRKNDRGREMFVIFSGQVSLSTVSDINRRVRFGNLGEGAMFGEIALFDNQERTATITAIQPTVLLVLEQRPFLKFVKENPSVSVKLLRTLATRLRYTDQIFEEALFGPLHIRLAKKLLALSRIFGETTKEGVKITINLSPQEVAKMLGTTTANINKPVKKLQDQKLIKFKEDLFTILDTKALSVIAG